jgi:hypothetical protein
MDGDCSRDECGGWCDDEGFLLWIESVEVEFGSVLVKVVDLGQPLVGRGGAEEVHVFVGVVLAVGELVDLLLAGEEVGVALEEALLQVVEDGHAQRLHSQPTSLQTYALAA